MRACSRLRHAGTPTPCKQAWASPNSKLRPHPRPSRPGAWGSCPLACMHACAGKYCCMQRAAAAPPTHLKAREGEVSASGPAHRTFAMPGTGTGNFRQHSSAEISVFPTVFHAGVRRSAPKMGGLAAKRAARAWMQAPPAICRRYSPAMAQIRPAAAPRASWSGACLWMFRRSTGGLRRARVP